MVDNHWLVVTGTMEFHDFPYILCNIYWEFHHPDWLSYFSEGLKPPTRDVYVYILLYIHRSAISVHYFHCFKPLNARFLGLEHPCSSPKNRQVADRSLTETQIFELLKDYVLHLEYWESQWGDDDDVSEKTLEVEGLGFLCFISNFGWNLGFLQSLPLFQAFSSCQRSNHPI